MDATKRFRRTISERSPALRPFRGLRGLAPEIMTEIIRHLNPASALALSQTCCGLRQIVDVYIGDVFPPAFDRDWLSSE